jgi:exodeoxyribonuclease-3
LVNGQKGYHGVAIVSKRPFASVSTRGFCGKDDARHAAVAITDGSANVVLHNF